MANNDDLRISEVARVAKCHIGTVRNYEKRGRIQSTRDLNNHRHFLLEEALKLREMLTRRIEA